MTFIRIQKGSGQQPQTLVFLPGWGFDGQVARYGMWPEDVDLCVPTHFCHAGLVAELMEYLAQEKIARVALVGWSMGANLAWQFATTYPDTVSSLSLLAARCHWPAAEIADIKADLHGDVQTSMQGFYRKCFLGHKGLYRRFVSELEGDYLARLHEPDLVADLDDLASWSLTGQAPAGVAVQVVHGRKDVVAPFAERPHIAGAVEKVVDGAGHLLFAHRHSYLLS
ncbi:MAG: alpha/beta hydrolase [Proteobacteria bacterium]|nr:alpha/beta hydrolase [Pseudomonadota bacterium]MBU1641399.1 alpha/beta hydrolase [Pseudomonadota bacterium]